MKTPISAKQMKPGKGDQLLKPKLGLRNPEHSVTVTIQVIMKSKSAPRATHRSPGILLATSGQWLERVSRGAFN
jgi:hypothetical protein